MAILKVVKSPNAVLKIKTEPVITVTDGDRHLIRDMIDTMYAERGVGLAANQVAVSKRIFVASLDQVRGRELVFLNPRIVRKIGRVKEFEGCLSVPELYEPVQRYKKVWIEAETPDGKKVEIVAEGLLARIFQHEIDHLNGLLFIDRIGFFKRRRLRRRLLDRAKEGGAG